MESYDRRRMERHFRRIEELGLWRDAREQNVEIWSFSIGDERSREMRLGDFWPEVALPVWLSAEVSIPEAWAGERVELELWLGGEGFVKLSNGVTSGLNPFHWRFPVAEKARGGEGVRIEAEVVSKGLWGSEVAEPRLERAALVVPETGARALERDLLVVVGTCEQLGGHEAVPRMLDAVDETLAALAVDWPTHGDASVARYLRGNMGGMGNGLSSLPPNISGRVRGARQRMRSLWSVPTVGGIQPLPEAARLAVERARRILEIRLNEIKEDHAPVGRLALTGHAHIDLAWLWPVSETRRKARRTFASVLGLMDRYQEFTFNQSSAQLYAWVEEDDPEMFARIRDRISEGRWETVGGSWTEPDCQIPSGESFVRQLLFGQKYFEEKFGRRCTVAWLPDVFGLSPGIPQLFRGAGISGFFTAKLKWNEANRFPLDLFEWEGIDGSRVTAHMTENPGMDYNGDIAPRDLLGVWRNFKGKRRHLESLFSFGWGDGGGGPSEEMLENQARLKDFPALPRLRAARVDEVFESFPKDGLPKWVGELYLELHRGTLTTQALVKKLNREAEHRLLEAEAFATMAALRGAEYPYQEFQKLWKTLLLNQFHDILPGSSVSEVYEDTHRQLRETVEDAERLRDDALHWLGKGVDSSAGGETVLVANASLDPRPLCVLVRGDFETEYATSAEDAEGNSLPVQETGEGALVHAPDVMVPGLGWTGIHVRRDRQTERPDTPGASSGRSGEGAFLENEFLRVEAGPDGSLHSVHDKEAEREVLDGRGNQLWAYVDKPREWDAWDVDEDYEKEGEELSTVENIEAVEEGPLRASVRVERRWRDSTIVQTYRLHAGSRRLDVETEVDWRERQVLLRAAFPLNVRSHEATFETMYGAQRRVTHQNTSFEAARFEVSAHRFCDLSEPGYGVALLNDGKYGHSVKDNVLGISLLRGPLYPDPRADEGVHAFTYSLFPHPGDWTQGGVVGEAFALNSPLVAVPGSGTSPASFAFAEAEGIKLALGSLKTAEDGRAVVLRLYEPHGARGVATLRFVDGIEWIERVNLLEEPEGELVEVEGDTVRFQVRPFEVLTLRVELENG